MLRLNLCLVFGKIFRLTMDGTKCSQAQGFNCRCTNIPVPKDQIIKHLEQPSRHALSKASSPKSSLKDFEDFKISLLKRSKASSKLSQIYKKHLLLL